MITRLIVVGVDGSPESAAAAAAAWMLARAAGVRCQLVHATYDARASLEFAGTGMPTESLQLALRARARATIGLALKESVPMPVIDAMIVRAGHTAAVLADVVADLDAAMLVLGGKHHSTLGRWLGGSTVQHVVRRVTVPLLVTAGDLRPSPRVLVAVDGSYAARPTVEQATSFAALLRSPLRALHVVEPLPANPGIWAGNIPGYEAWWRDAIERDIWTLLPIPDQHKVIRPGMPLETIAEEAAAWRADVIVVGSHGRGWLDRLLIGSVTEGLLNDLPAAVLVVPVPAPVRPEIARIPLPAALTLA